MRDRNVVLGRLSASLWARRSSYCSASAAQPGRAAEAEQIISIVLTAGHIQLHLLAVLCPKDGLGRLRSVPRTVFLPDRNVFLPAGVRSVFYPRTACGSAAQHTGAQPPAVPQHSRSPPAESATQHFQPIRYMHSSTCQIPFLLFSIFFIRSMPTYPFIHNSSYICQFTTFSPMQPLSPTNPPQKAQKRIQNGTVLYPLVSIRF